MSTALQTTSNENPASAPIVEFSAFGNISHFENAQRMAKALASSSIVPAAYQGDVNIGSCVIALEIANRIGASVLAVMQNLYVVHGKPGWSSQFLISCVNASRKFSPLRYEMTGKPGQDDWGCIAWATDRTGEVLKAPEVTIGMAKAEGWYSKNGSKWKTMPELMLRYRTATLFARLYAPELTMGIQTADEISDVVEISASVSPTPPAPSFAKVESKPAVDAKPIKIKRDAPTITVVPTPAPVTEPTPEPVAPAPEPEQSAPPADKSFEEIVDGDDLAPESPEITALRAAMKQHDVSLPELLVFVTNRKLLVEGCEAATKMTDIRPDKLSPLARNILANGVTLKQIKGIQ